MKGGELPAYKQTQQRATKEAGCAPYPPRKITTIRSEFSPGSCENSQKRRNIQRQSEPWGRGTAVSQNITPKQDNVHGRNITPRLAFATAPSHSNDVKNKRRAHPCDSLSSYSTSTAPHARRVKVLIAADGSSSNRTGTWQTSKIEYGRIHQCPFMLS